MLLRRVRVEKVENLERAARMRIRTPAFLSS